MKYLAIKVEGLDFWLWFQKEAVSEENGVFKGDCGWGKNGAATSITINTNKITGRIKTNTLQY